ACQRSRTWRTFLLMVDMTQLQAIYGGFRAIGQRVADVPHGTFRFAVFHFEVGNGGAQFRVPLVS
ncbi:hypothetical protein R1N01_29205, partial [Klebsiella sp. 78128]